MGSCTQRRDAGSGTQEASKRSRAMTICKQKPMHTLAERGLFLALKTLGKNHSR